MFQTTPQERLALGVTALLLSAGAGLRLATNDPPPAEWANPADTIGDGTVSALLEGVALETELRRRAEAPLAPGERIDPSRASVTDLDRLPGVGPALAERIVAHRDDHGPFRSLADIDAVSGVGPAMLEDIAPHLALPATAGSPSGVPPRAADRVDINTATADELHVLPGIGPALAARIIEWRGEHGPFRSMDDLDLVPGIGPALRERLEPLVRM
jgi:competence protein ComEA